MILKDKSLLKPKRNLYLKNKSLDNKLLMDTKDQCFITFLNY